MKILFVSDNFYPETNAAASRVYERAKYWVQSGHQVTILTSNPNFPEGKVYEGYKNSWRKSENIDGIRVVRVKTFIAQNRGVRRRMVDFLSFMFSSIFFSLFEKRPDVVVATSPQFFSAVAGYVISILKRRPLGLEIADLWPESVRAVDVMKDNVFLDFMEKVELFLYRRARFIVTLTESFRENMKHRGVDGAKITTVINGVDTKFFKPLKVRDSSLVTEYSLQGKFVVGYLGTLGLAHGLSNLLHVAREFEEDGEDRFHFLIVGTGAERSLLKSLALDYGLKNLTFIDRQPKDEIARYWSLCDVGLVHLKNSRVFESVIPSKIFEAMAQGVPVVYCGPESDGSRIVVEEQIGVYVPGEDFKALGVRLKSLVADPEGCATYRENALRVVPNYTREQQSSHFLDVIEKAMGS